LAAEEPVVVRKAIAPPSVSPPRYFNSRFS
jgi:hypothetical protein